MAHDEIRGTVWSDAELDLIVADHFSMLTKELKGESYVKRHHSTELMKAVHRSHRSVEFKHQNISAVLDKLGLLWIPGYRPKENFQNAIFDAIDRYLSSSSGILTMTPSAEPHLSPSEDVMVQPPSKMALQPPPISLQRLIRKFDPVERDRKNRVLGRLGERFVVDLERNALTLAGLSKLAQKVRWVSDELGDGAGFDVESYDHYGNYKFIEVKTTNGTARTPFFISRNEMEFAEERSHEWHLYRVHLFATSPKIFTLTSPLATSVNLTTEVWRALFN